MPKRIIVSYTTYIQFNRSKLTAQTEPRGPITLQTLPVSSCLLPLSTPSALLPIAKPISNLGDIRHDRAISVLLRRRPDIVSGCEALYAGQPPSPDFLLSSVRLPFRNEETMCVSALVDLARPPDQQKFGTYAKFAVDLRQPTHRQPLGSKSGLKNAVRFASPDAMLRPAQSYLDHGRLLQNALAAYVHQSALSERLARYFSLRDLYSANVCVEDLADAASVQTVVKSAPPPTAQPVRITLKKPTSEPRQELRNESIIVISVSLEGNEADPLLTEPCSVAEFNQYQFNEADREHYVVQVMFNLQPEKNVYSVETPSQKRQPHRSRSSEHNNNTRELFAEGDRDLAEVKFTDIDNQNTFPPIKPCLEHLQQDRIFEFINLVKEASRPVMFGYPIFQVLNKLSEVIPQGIDQIDTTGKKTLAEVLKTSSNLLCFMQAWMQLPVNGQSIFTNIISSLLCNKWDMSAIFNSFFRVIIGINDQLFHRLRLQQCASYFRFCMKLNNKRTNNFCTIIPAYYVAWACTRRFGLSTVHDVQAAHHEIEQDKYDDYDPEKPPQSLFLLIQYMTRLQCQRVTNQRNEPKNMSDKIEEFYDILCKHRKLNTLTPDTLKETRQKCGIDEYCQNSVEERFGSNDDIDGKILFPSESIKIQNEKSIFSPGKPQTHAQILEVRIDTNVFETMPKVDEFDNVTEQIMNQMIEFAGISFSYSSLECQIDHTSQMNTTTHDIHIDYKEDKIVTNQQKCEEVVSIEPSNFSKFLLEFHERDSFSFLNQNIQIEIPRLQVFARCQSLSELVDQIGIDFFQKLWFDIDALLLLIDLQQNPELFKPALLYDGISYEFTPLAVLDPQSYSVRFGANPIEQQKILFSHYDGRFREMNASLYSLIAPHMCNDDIRGYLSRFPNTCYEFIGFGAAQLMDHLGIVESISNALGSEQTYDLQQTQPVEDIPMNNLTSCQQLVIDDMFDTSPFDFIISNMEDVYSIWCGSTASIPVDVVAAIDGFSTNRNRFDFITGKQAYWDLEASNMALQLASDEYLLVRFEDIATSFSFWNCSLNFNINQGIKKDLFILEARLSGLRKAKLLQDGLLDPDSPDSDCRQLQSFQGVTRVLQQYRAATGIEVGLGLNRNVPLAISRIGCEPGRIQAPLFKRYGPLERTGQVPLYDVLGRQLRTQTSYRLSFRSAANDPAVTESEPPPAPQAAAEASTAQLMGVLQNERARRFNIPGLDVDALGNVMYCAEQREMLCGMAASHTALQVQNDEKRLNCRCGQFVSVFYPYVRRYPHDADLLHLPPTFVPTFERASVTRIITQRVAEHMQMERDAARVQTALECIQCNQTRIQDALFEDLLNLVQQYPILGQIFSEGDHALDRVGQLFSHGIASQEFQQQHSNVYEEYKSRNGPIEVFQQMQDRSRQLELAAGYNKRINLNLQLKLQEQIMFDAMDDDQELACTLISTHWGRDCQNHRLHKTQKIGYDQLALGGFDTENSMVETSSLQSIQEILKEACPSDLSSAILGANELDFREMNIFK